MKDPPIRRVAAFFKLTHKVFRWTPKIFFAAAARCYIINEDRWACPRRRPAHFTDEAVWGRADPPFLSIKLSQNVSCLYSLLFFVMNALPHLVYPLDFGSWGLLRYLHSLEDDHSNGSFRGVFLEVVLPPSSSSSILIWWSLFLFPDSPGTLQWTVGVDVGVCVCCWGGVSPSAWLCLCLGWSRPRVPTLTPSGSCLALFSWLVAALTSGWSFPNSFWLKLHTCLLLAHSHFFGFMFLPIL